MVSEPKYLTVEEVVERYREMVSSKTLEGWRSKGVGPPYVKIGKAVLYPATEIDAWDRAQVVAGSVHFKTGRTGPEGE
jgi:predicted DNA-binding transcriptional regulator AlpA